MAARGTMAAIVAVGAAALGLALGLRYGLLEAGRLPADCGADPGWACRFKTALVWSFLGNKLGWLALGSGAAAFVSGYRPLAWLGWVTGLSGLVLYCFDASAVGGLAALLALVRSPQPGTGGEQQAAQPPGDGLGIGRLA
jgi:hypothetical protein